MPLPHSPRSGRQRKELFFTIHLSVNPSLGEGQGWVSPLSEPFSWGGAGVGLTSPPMLQIYEKLR